MTDPNSLTQAELSFLRMRVICDVDHADKNALYVIYCKLDGTMSKPEFLRTVQ